MATAQQPLSPKPEVHHLTKKPVEGVAPINLLSIALKNNAADRRDRAFGRIAGKSHASRRRDCLQRSAQPHSGTNQAGRVPTCSMHKPIVGRLLMPPLTG